MKKYSSVISLYIRNSIFKVLGIILLMCALQTVAFYNNLTSEEANLEPDKLLGLEHIFSMNTDFTNILGIAFAAITFLLCFYGSEIGSRQGYTLRRLIISEKEVFICQAIANTLMYALLILSEIILCYALCLCYVNVAQTVNYPYDGVVSNQVIFLAFYREYFLHALLPMDDIIRYFVNLITFSAMGITSAAFPYFQRRKRLSLEVFLLMIITCFNFRGDWQMYTYDLILSGVSVFFIGLIVFRISMEEKAYER